MLLSLTACVACSTVNEAPAERPPDYLLKRAEPLPKPHVETTEDIVRRLIHAESEYEGLRSRHNVLVDWIAPPET